MKMIYNDTWIEQTGDEDVEEEEICIDVGRKDTDQWRF